MEQLIPWPRLERGVALWVVVALCGCGASSSSGRLAGTDLGVEVEAPAPSAPAYRTSPSEGPVLGAEGAAEIDAGIRAAASAEGITLVGDGRLALLAAWTLERLGDGGALPPNAVIEFFSLHLGMPEPVPHLLMLGQTDPSRFTDGIRDSVVRFLQRQPYTHYGAAVVRRGGLSLAMVALSNRALELEPVPRRVEAGEPIELRGRLAAGLASPTVAIRPPEGEVTRQAVGAGPSFEVDLPTAEPGIYQVEVLAEGPRGDTVLANFPVYAGVEVPRSIVLDTTPHDSGDPGRVDTDLFALLNQARAERGLPALTLHEGLSQVAEAHSRDMVDHDFVGHDSPTTGGAVDRVAAAGFRSGLVLENIGRGYGAADIHTGLMQSPGHRANILNPDVTHVGIGVVSEEEDGRLAFVATEVFIRMIPSIDTAAAPRELLAMLNAARRARGAEPLELDDNLQDAAQGAAADYFADPSLGPQDAVDQASGAMRRFAIAFRRVGGLMALVSSLEEAGRMEPALDPEVRYVGIGVAQGDRPDLAPNTIGVLILLGWAR